MCILNLVKKFALIVSSIVTVFIAAGSAFAHGDLVPVSVLERDTCAHCRDEKAFLTDLQKRRDDIEVILHDITTPEGRALFDQVTELDNLSKVTPITLVGNTIIQGFQTAETTGKRIVDLIEASVDKDTMTFPEYIEAGGGSAVEHIEGGGCSDDPEEGCDVTNGGGEFVYDLPFVGEVDLRAYSLPALSLILGFVDGFNPCAMWVLVVFLTVLLQVGDRRKMFTIAGIFILAEAVMYYLILNVWLTTWDFVGLDQIVTPVVGTVAIGGGLFFLYEFWRSDGTCKVTSHEKRRRTRDRIEALAANPLTWLSFFGIIGLAFSVNIIEFACSIGIPQAFTKILDLNPIGFLARQVYMALYILMYMVDDLIVFGIALWGFEAFGLHAQKYAKWCNLLGGLLMLLLGALLIFAPEALVLQ